MHIGHRFWSLASLRLQIGLSVLKHANEMSIIGFLNVFVLEKYCGVSVLALKCADVNVHKVSIDSMSWFFANLIV